MPTGALVTSVTSTREGSKRTPDHIVVREWILTPTHTTITGRSHSERLATHRSGERVPVLLVDERHHPSWILQAKTPERGRASHYGQPQAVSLVRAHLWRAAMVMRLLREPPHVALQVSGDCRNVVRTRRSCSNASIPQRCAAHLEQRHEAGARISLFGFQLTGFQIASYLEDERSVPEHYVRYLGTHDYNVEGLLLLE